MHPYGGMALGLAIRYNAIAKTTYDNPRDIVLLIAHSPRVIFLMISS